MEEHAVKILNIESVTHDVRRFTIEKPASYSFIPGQATEIAVARPGWEKERRPFTFTSLNTWDTLEFTIKIYPEHKGVTAQLGQLVAGDEILLHDVWGAIQYKGEGTFIAGGAGVTPFIAIFRQLKQDGLLGMNRLICSNKTVSDIILREEFEEMLGERFINTITREKKPGFAHRKIDESYLREMIQDTRQQFYVCGPDAMVSDIKTALEKIIGRDAAITVEL